jgi:hypothetical protein
MISIAKLIITLFFVINDNIIPLIVIANIIIINASDSNIKYLFCLFCILKLLVSLP